jgi:hypothetical protein
MAAVKAWFTIPATGDGSMGNPFTPDFQGVAVYGSSCPYRTPSGDFVCLVCLEDTNVDALTKKPHTTFIGYRNDTTLQSKLDNYTAAHTLPHIDLSQYDVAC